jgi:site-specific DNA-cytosine methylase
MNVLELYAGSRSIGKVAKARGHNVCSVDIKQFGDIDLIVDCEFLTINDLPFIPDMLWSGTPCTTYSLAGISHHRNIDRSPKSMFAEKCDRMNINNLKLIDDILEINPKLIWYIENPRAVLRKMEFMKGLNRTTVTYCSYGDTRMKPTDIWSNNIRDVFNPMGWKPIEMCYNGNSKCQHEPSPRGSRTGTQGLKNNHERSKMPTELCEDIIIATEKKLNYET